MHEIADVIGHHQARHGGSHAACVGVLAPGSRQRGIGADHLIADLTGIRLDEGFQPRYQGFDNQGGREVACRGTTDTISDQQ
ncbi:hypothetical protein brsh051_01070 [Brooklawnia propionicigenes]|uniref:Uncharacterized protein n=1 Tax=Brooklawnia propionicigenes TaxID=3041175 RepID=A0AAN0K5Q2_9ACTN|nr:hypothetical protein brsh051_01070 [Brooklawnia sp. SH051]